MVRAVTGCPSAREFSAYDCTRLALGLVLLTAAALKGHQLATEPLPEKGLLSSRWFLIGVVEFELFFGLWLLSGLYPKWTWPAALACFSGFACVTLYKALSGESSCGCFGRVPVNPWYSFLLDLTAVAALLAFRPIRLPLRERAGVREVASSPAGRRRVRARLAAICAMFLAAGLPASWAMATYQAGALDDLGQVIGSGRLILLEPHKWIGKRCPLLSYIDIRGQLAQGEWVVILHRHNCPKCQELLSRLAKDGRDRRSGLETRRIALVEIPPYAVGLGMPASSCLAGRLEDTRRWFAETPLVVHLTEQRVTRIAHDFGEPAEHSEKLTQHTIAMVEDK